MIFQMLMGSPGYFSQVLSVYGREDMPCVRCNVKIKRIIQNQRATYYCPKCQTLADSKTLFQATCATNSEPYALQNIGDMMSPEFSENCIIIIDPSMPIHHEGLCN